jgi:hypothetical protein
LMAVIVLILVWVLGDNGSPQRSEEIHIALAQSVRAQTAPADQIPTCEQLLREFESDPRTQRASPAERQFVQAFVQGLLDQGVPGASRLDPDGNGIACDELLSAGGGQSASASRSSPQPSVDRGSQLLNRYGNLLEAGGPASGPVPLSCPTVAAHESSLQCGTGPATRAKKVSIHLRVLAAPPPAAYQPGGRRITRNLYAPRRLSSA